MSEFKMSYENFFGAKTSVMLFISFENSRKQQKGSHESTCKCVNQWVSNYRYPITKSSNWIPVIGHPCDCVLIMLQIREGEPIMIKNFVIDTFTLLTGT